MIIVDVALGALFVVVYAIDRFWTPPTNRSSTTAARFYTGMASYCAVGLALYGLVVNYPHLVRFFVGEHELPGFAREYSAPLLSALLLTVLLPKVPILADIDRRIREQIQYMAAIPQQARDLSAELRRAPFEFTEGVRARVTEVLGETLAPEDIVFEKSARPHYLWTKVTALMQQLGGWEGYAAQPRFVAAFPAEFEALCKRYDALVPKARRCCEMLRDNSLPGSRTGTWAGEMLREFRAEVQGLYQDVCDFISHGILKSQLTHRARIAELRELGFDPELPPPGISLDQLVWLFMVLVSTLVGALTFLAPEGGDRVDRFLLGPMIAAIYVTGVWCAIHPKTRFARARRSPGAFRPVATYFLSALAASAIGILISAAFKSVGHYVSVYSGSTEELLESIARTPPWAVLTFTTTFATAWCCDNVSKLRRLHLRALEAAGQALVTGAASILVVELLHATGVRPRTPFPVIVAVAAAIGFAIGWLVPTWYRDALRRQDEAASRAVRPMELVAAADSPVAEGVRDVASAAVAGRSRSR